MTPDIAEIVLVTCPTCDGLGGSELTLEDELYAGPGSLAVCYTCKGTGWVRADDDEEDPDDAG